MTNWKNKIKRKALGEAPTEASTNIRAPELAPTLVISRWEVKAQLPSLRTQQLGLKITPEFAKRLKKLAYEEDCYLVEILEKAVECYERERSTKEYNN